MTTSILAGLGILILILLLIKILLPMSEEEKKQIRKAAAWETYLMKICRQRKLNWNEKINRLKKEKNWQREELVKELYGGVPKYLFYEVKRKLTREETEELINYFWDGERDFGDLEMHKNLRIRNAKRFTSLLFGEFPLVQAGHCQPWQTIDKEGFPEGVITF